MFEVVAIAHPPRLQTRHQPPSSYSIAELLDLDVHMCQGIAIQTHDHYLPNLWNILDLVLSLEDGMLTHHHTIWVQDSQRRLDSLAGPGRQERTYVVLL